MNKQTDGQRAREELENGEYSCVFIKGDQRIAKKMKGISPVVELWEQGVPEGGAAADRIVGRAAALLLAGLKCSFVYGDVMSEGAVQVLEEYGISYDYGELTASIRNRAGTGECPMEKAVAKENTPRNAYRRVKEALARLRMPQDI